MSKQKSKMNNLPSEQIEEAFLDEFPEQLPTNQKVVVAEHIPEMKKAIFLNGRDPGVPLEFHYHSKNCPLKHYTLYHGAETVLPVEIIRHLEGCSEPIYAYRTNQQGLPEHYVKSVRYIFTFKNLQAA